MHNFGWRWKNFVSNAVFRKQNKRDPCLVMVEIACQICQSLDYKSLSYLNQVTELIIVYDVQEPWSWFNFWFFLFLFLTAYRYIPILTNDATPGAGKWALFGHCWDVNKIGDSINSLVSWNVFSLTKTLTSADKLKIITRLAQIGFRINKSTLIEIKFP